MALTAYDGGREGRLSGEEVLDELFDLIRLRLPRLAPEDPVHGSLSRLAPYLGQSLGRPTVEIVPPIEQEA